VVGWPKNEVNGLDKNKKMKKRQLIAHLKKNGATLLRGGSRHTIYQKGVYKTQIPRHNEIVD
jgi:hypothetical protein